MSVDSILSDFGETLTHISFTNILPAAAILVVCLILRRLILSFLRKQLNANPQGSSLSPVILRISSIALSILTVILVCGCLDIPLTSLVALLSIFTLAVSLAAQDVLANLAGGLSLLYSKPFKVGDYILSNDVNGTAEELGLIYTRLSTPDKKIISIPNKTLASSIITNYSSSTTRRVDWTISASYEDDVEHVLSVLMQTVAANEKVMQDPAPFVGVNKYGESCVEYVIRAWCQAQDYWDLYFELQNSFPAVFKKHGIHMNYPHLNVHINKEN